MYEHIGEQQQPKAGKTEEPDDSLRALFPDADDEPDVGGSPGEPSDDSVDGELDDEPDADAGDTGKPAADTGGPVRITYTVRGKPRVFELDPSDPVSLERLRLQLEKAGGAEIRDYEKNREIERLRRELDDRRRREAQEEEQEFLRQRVPPLQDYVEAYGDEKLASTERERDIRLAKLEYQQERDRREREEQRRVQESERLLRQAMERMKRRGFTDEEINHAIMKAPSWGVETLEAALRCEFPERFVADAGRGKGKGGQEMAGVKRNKTLPAGGVRKKSRGGLRSEDIAVASRLCQGAPGKEIERAGMLLRADPVKARQLLRALRRPPARRETRSGGGTRR